MINNLNIFICPNCEAGLKIDGNIISCSKCSNQYRVEDNVPLLFLPNEWDNRKKDVTNTIKAFYEETPFPNYEELENIGDLVQKAQKKIFPRLLNEQIPFNVRVLEVGCGTGQLSNFLGVAQRFVFGTDMCLNSLRLGQDFKRKNNLERVGFYQMNLFKPIFKPETFSLVICNGVLHHTSDPFEGFKSISKLVKKQGYIIVGLYNKYGRIATDIRRIIFSIFNNRLKFIDPRLRDQETGGVKKNTWFKDQYKNPHESKHTVDEVLKWFDLTGFDFINSIPKIKFFDKFSEEERLFKKNQRGSWFEHLITQISMVFTGSKEGGLFLIIGRKRI